jgi:hypothetical protein
VAPSVKAPRRSKWHLRVGRSLIADVWKNLSVKEANEVRKWLYDPARGLNMTGIRGAADR